jgi:hypothetical protein
MKPNALIRDSYKVAEYLAKKGKFFTDVKFVKSCFFWSVSAIGSEKIVRLQCIILLAPKLTREQKIQWQISTNIRKKKQSYFFIYRQHYMEIMMSLKLLKSFLFTFA